MRLPTLLRRSPESPPILTFAPLAWLKLQFFCHFGNNEIGGFGISAAQDLLCIEDFVTVRQRVSLASVHFDDAAVADYFDACVDRGILPAQCGRIWLHTHPGASVTPSGTDEETFARVFGRCDWSVMFILGRTGQTYARLAFPAGPGGCLHLPAQVDWSSWPELLAAAPETMSEVFDQWQQEYAANIDKIEGWWPEWSQADGAAAARPVAKQRVQHAAAEAAWPNYEEFLYDEWHQRAYQKD